MPTVNEILQDQAIHHSAVDLMRIEAGSRKKVYAMLKKLQADLLKQLVTIDPSAPPKTAVQAKRLAALLKQTKKTINTFKDTAIKTGAKDLYNIAEVESHLVSGKMNAALGTNVSSVAISKNRLKAIADKTIVQGKYPKEWWSKQAQSMQDKFSNEMRMGMNQHESIGKLSKRIRKNVIPVSRRNADALVRTSQAAVVAQAKQAAYKEMSDLIKGFKYSATLDNRTTPYCQAADGTILSKSYKVVAGARWVTPPPSHWNCRSVLIPITKSWAQLSKQFKGTKLGKKLDKVPSKTRASMDGKVPKDVSYTEWLKTKSDDFQDEVLGVTKAKFFRDGKITHLSQLLDQSGDPLTILELKKKMATGLTDVITGKLMLTGLSKQGKKVAATMKDISTAMGDLLDPDEVLTFYADTPVDKKLYKPIKKPRVIEDEIWEPDFEEVAGFRQSTGGVIFDEKTGKVWLVEPKDHFGGYEHTFPKGGVKKGVSYQQNALNEIWEESGLDVEFLDHLGDYKKISTNNRYYVGRVTGGDPTKFGWESQSVKLIPQDKVKSFLNKKVDQDIFDAFQKSWNDVKRSDDTSIADAFRLNNKKKQVAYLEAKKKADADALVEAKRKAIAEAKEAKAAARKAKRDAVKAAKAEAKAEAEKKAALELKAREEVLRKEAELAAKAEAIKVEAALKSKRIPKSSLYKDLENRLDIDRVSAAISDIKLGKVIYDVESASGKADFLSKMRKYLTKYKKVVVAGGKPTKTQLEAFDWLSEDSQKIFLREIDDLVDAGDSLLLGDLELLPDDVPKIDIVPPTGPMLDMKDFVKYKDAKGSNPGGFYHRKDNPADRWYFKETGEDAAYNEILAGKLYERAGVYVPELVPVKVGNEVGVASRIIDGVEESLSKLKSGKFTADIEDNFMMDAFLANWDVVGANYDNMVMVGGKVLRVDVGGSLRYRAKAGLKGSSWDDAVSEITSLREGHKNPTASTVFQNVTDDQLETGARKVLALSEKDIKQLVKIHSPNLSTSDTNKLITTLLARRKTIAELYPDSLPLKERMLAKAAAKKEAKALKKRMAAFKEADLGLSDRQIKTLDLPSTEANLTYDVVQQLQTLAKRHRDMQLTSKQIKKLAVLLEDTTDIHINASIQSPSSEVYQSFKKYGEFKNQFQLGRKATSGGSLSPYKGGGRDRWEDTMSKGILQSNPDYKKMKDGGFFDPKVADERPIYGYVSDPGRSRGARAGGSYGEVSMKLKPHIKQRLTMTQGNSSGFTRAHSALMNNKNQVPLLEELMSSNRITNDQLLEILEGTRPIGGFTSGSYVEAQIYGGVNFANDVEEIIVRQDYPHLKRLAKRWGVKYRVVKSGQLRYDKKSF